MSSSLYLINWCPNSITATLNTQPLSPPIKPSRSRIQLLSDIHLPFLATRPFPGSPGCGAMTTR